MVPARPRRQPEIPAPPRRHAVAGGASRGAASQVCHRARHWSSPLPKCAGAVPPSAGNSIAAERHTVSWLTGWPVTREALLLVAPEAEDDVLLVSFFNHVPQARRLSATRVEWSG